MQQQSIWKILGIERTDSRDRIRRAYTRKLKSTNPEDDAEGFKRLRAAYEAALRGAKQPAHAQSSMEACVQPLEPAAEVEPVPASRAERVAATATPPGPASSEAAPLREDFSRLRALLADTDSEAEQLAAALSAVCANPALEQVSVRLELEAALAELVLAHTPRSNALVVRAAEVFGWDRRSRVLGQTPVLDAAAKCARAVTYLDELESGTHLLSKAYRALTTAPSTLRLRAASYLFGLDKQVRQLRFYLTNELALARPPLNEDAVRWWTSYFAKPRLSRWMLLACVLSPFVAVLLVQPKVPSAMEGVFILTLAAVAAAAALKLYVIDRGREALQRRLAARGSLVLRFGWLPAGAALVLLAGTEAGGGILAKTAAAAAVACAVWAWLAHTVPPVGLIGSNRQIMIGNLALGCWIAALLVALPPASVIAFAALAIAHLIGETSLSEFYLTVFSPRSRAQVSAGLLLAAALVLAAMLESPSRFAGLFAAVALTVILLQRTAAVVLTQKQRQARFVMTWLLVFVSALALGDVLTAPRQLEVLVAWYLGSCIVALTMCFRNDLQHVRRSAPS